MRDGETRGVFSLGMISSENRCPLFPRDKRGTRLLGDHAQLKTPRVSPSRIWISRSYKGPGLRMSDMRLGRLMQGVDGDHSACTLSDRVAHMSPSSSDAGAQ